MAATLSCEKCKFSDKKALAKWNKGKQTPYCTHPNRQLNNDGDCLSGRD